MKRGGVIEGELRPCGSCFSHVAHTWYATDGDVQRPYLCTGIPGGYGGPRTAGPPSLRADDEPVFTIRAQDILAPQALAAYAALARKLDLNEHAQRVEAIAVDFLAWQAAHTKQVKRPD